MAWLNSWKIWRRKRKARQEAEALERKRAAQHAQIARRKSSGEAWVPLMGDYQKTTTAALNAERWL
jgi:type II secretory pathway pseudopilin PulG